MTGLRERKHEQTRQALIGALRADVLAGAALADVTVETISDTADVSARTFFRYFATKDDCALAACGIPADVHRLPIDPELLPGIDARLLQALVRTEPRLLGVAFERLSGGRRPRFSAAAWALEHLLDPHAAGLGVGAALTGKP